MFSNCREESVDFNIQHTSIIGGIDMNLYKYILLGIILLVLLAATVLISSGCMNKKSENPSAELSECIESINQGKTDELSLTIYYMDPYILTRAPVKEKDLIESLFEYKITISGEKLRDNIDLLDQVANATLIPVVEQGFDGFARLYYVFETKNNSKIFSVCMWNGKGGIFVNGAQVEEDDVFYNVIMPFLPEDAVEKLETYLNGRFSETKE